MMNRNPWSLLLVPDLCVVILRLEALHLNQYVLLKQANQVAMLFCKQMSTARIPKQRRKHPLLLNVWPKLHLFLDVIVIFPWLHLVCCNTVSHGALILYGTSSALTDKRISMMSWLTVYCTVLMFFMWTRSKWLHKVKYVGSKAENRTDGQKALLLFKFCFMFLLIFKDICFYSWSHHRES